MFYLPPSPAPLTRASARTPFLPPNQVHFISGPHTGESAVLLPRAVQHAVTLKTLMGHNESLADEIPEVRTYVFHALCNRYEQLYNLRGLQQ